MTKNITTPIHLLASITSVIALAMLLPAFAVACPSYYSLPSWDETYGYDTTVISDPGSTSVAAYADISITGGSDSNLWDTGTTYASAFVQAAWGNQTMATTTGATNDDGGEGGGYYYVQDAINRVPSYVAWVYTIGTPAALTTAGCTALRLTGSGWRKDVKMQLKDQGGYPIKSSGILMSDTLTVNPPPAPNALNMGNGSLTGEGYTDSNGQWTDTYLVCSTACPVSGQSNVTQLWKANSTWVTYTNNIVYQCTGITIDGN